MRLLPATLLSVVSLGLGGCGAPEGIVLLSPEARQAGIRLDLGAGPLQRVLPTAVAAGERLRLVMPDHEQFLQLEPGEVALVQGDGYETLAEDVEGLLVRGEPQAIDTLVALLEARVLAAEPGMAVLVGDAGAPLLESAADLDDIAGLSEVRPATLAELGRGGPAPAALPAPPSLAPRSMALPVANAPAVVAASGRFTQYFSSCGARLPVGGRAWTLRVDGQLFAEGLTDHLGLIIVETPPAGPFELEVENGVPAPRPYAFDRRDPGTFANVAAGLESEDLDTLLYALEDAALIADPAWAPLLVRRLSHAHPGVWILAAAALGSYDRAIAQAAVQSLPLERRSHVLHAAGVAPMSLAPDALYALR